MIRLNIARINEETRIVAGKVKTIAPEETTTGKKLVKVTLEGSVWDKENKKEIPTDLEIQFWNTDQSNMADRVEKAKMEPGAVICCRIHEVTKDDDTTVAYAQNFMYRGLWTYPAQKEGYTNNIVMGVVANVKEFTSETGELRCLNVAVPVSVQGQEESEWKHISLWNSDLSTLGTRAKKCLYPGDDGRKKHAIFICGSETERNGFKNMSAFDFVLI